MQDDMQDDMQDAPTLYLKAPLAIWTGTGQNADGGIVLRGDRILELVPRGGLPTCRIDQVLDVSAHVVIPGLVNCHHHLYQTLTRVIPAALNRELFGWLECLYPLWGQLRPDALAIATRLGLVELLMSGCTTAADHHYIYTAELPDALDIQFEAARDLGMRLTLTRGSMSQGQSQGALPPDHVVQKEDVILADCERVITAYHDPTEASFCQVALSPCSPFSVSAELMRDTAHMARASGVRMHTHLAETADETRYCIERFGKRPLSYVADLGWVGPDVWLAHGIHFDASEIALLGQTKTGVCHCPHSNMILASGICPVGDLESAGAPVGLGVDGSASNCAGNLMAETRQALLLQRLRYGAASVTERDALRWATSGGAALLGRPELGTLAAGKLADVAMYRVADLRFSGSVDHLAALILCGALAADHVLVGGRFVVRDGQVPGVDLTQLRAAHDRARDALLMGTP